jgi:hypothetical protein
VKLSKDNPIKVEWQAVAPPNPDKNLIVADYPMSILAAASTPTQDADKMGW